MKYRVACFMYDLPENSCAFCQDAEIFWDFTSGIYMVTCDQGNNVNTERFIKGCNTKRNYPEGTKFT